MRKAQRPGARRAPRSRPRRRDERGAKSVAANLEYVILETIANSTGGIGAASVVLHLSDQSVRTNPSTVGRALLLLDHRGLTAKIGNKGRVLTAAGRRHLEELRQWEGLRYWVENTLKQTRPATQNEYFEALYALRFLEGHLSRLAAERATADQVGAMRRILEQHQEKLNTVTLGRDQGLGFHTLLAKAAGNMFLEIAVDMIWSWNRVMRELWAHAYPITGRFSYPDHVRIFSAISGNDPAGAERAMHAHYDIFIEGFKRQFASAGSGAPSTGLESLLRLPMPGELQELQDRITAAGETGALADAEEEPEGNC